MALPIELRGHDFRYAAEQALMAFLPEFGGEGDRLISALEGCRAEAALRFRGSDYGGSAEQAGPLPEEELPRRRVLQRLVKESIFRACVSALGQAPPWGSLTGVRPGKLAARHMAEAGRNEEETALWLQKEYSLSPRRAALCAKTAKTGLEIKDGLGEKDIILYVGIPFCPTRCAYCSFVSHSVEKSLKLVEPYVEALGREIDDAGSLARALGLQVRAVYWGGGTPRTRNSCGALWTGWRRPFGCPPAWSTPWRPDGQTPLPGKSSPSSKTRASRASASIPSPWTTGCWRPSAAATASGMCGRALLWPGRISVGRSIWT